MFLRDKRLLAKNTKNTQLNQK